MQVGVAFAITTLADRFEPLEDMDNEVARCSMELFAKECLPMLSTWGREPATSRAAD